MSTAHLTQEEFRESFNPAQSRIQILSAPIQLPGICTLCGTSRTDDRQYIDLGMWVEFVGQIYFCTYCMTEMVNRLGGHTAEQAAEIETELNAARQTIIEFHAKEQALDGAINSLIASGLFSSSTFSNIISPNGSDSEQDVRSVDSELEGHEQLTIESAIDDTEVITEQRPDDVSAIGSDEFDIDKWI